jgi:hypothetical protein
LRESIVKTVVHDSILLVPSGRIERDFGLCKHSAQAIVFIVSHENVLVVREGEDRTAIDRQTDAADKPGKDQQY